MNGTQADSAKKQIPVVAALSTMLGLFGLVIGAISVGMDKQVEPWWVGFVMTGVMGLSISRVLKSLAESNDTARKPE